MKQKIQEKYIPDYYKHRLLDKLHSLHQDSRSIQEYTTKFDDISLRCEVQEDYYQAISRYHFRLRLDIQRVTFIHSHKIETLEQASQLAQDIKTSLRFSTERRDIPKIGEQPSLNTHITKDSKGKSVIGESSGRLRVVNVLSVKVMITLLYSAPLGETS